MTYPIAPKEKFSEDVACLIFGIWEIPVPIVTTEASAFAMVVMSPF